jgi:hypothetical protein
MLKKIKYLFNHPLFLWMILALAIVPSLPYFRFLIETSMAFHMAVQIPLLMIAGYFLADQFDSIKSSLAVNLSCWLWIAFASIFWMLPISLDKALLNPYWDIFKMISLLLAGFLLKPALAGSKILALFFIGSSVMMLVFIGYFYQDSTLRLCNSYLIESQKTAGLGLMAWAASILLTAIIAISKNISID